MTRMMDLVADTRRMAYGSMADQLNFLSAEAPLGAAELEMVMDVAPITPGMVLSSGLNVYYVIGTIPAEKKVLVYPSYDNSMSEALPVGAPIMIRPRVTDWMLFTYLNDIIKSLSSPSHGLYREGTWEDPNTFAVWSTYDIPPEAADMVNLLRVQARYWQTTDPDLWIDIPSNLVEWQPERGIVRLKTQIPGGTTLRFDYRAPFKRATALTDDLTVDLGLPESMVDIPPLGAASRLLRSTESRRVQIHNQGDPRRADESQPGSNSSAARDFYREFQQRINDEYARLVNRNPITRSIP